MGNRVSIQSGVVKVTTKASSTSLADLVPTNTSRNALYVVNDSTAILTLYGDVAANTPTAKIAIIPANSAWLCPADYTGPVSGQWAAANGNAYLSEYE